MHLSCTCGYQTGYLLVWVPDNLKQQIVLLTPVLRNPHRILGPKADKRRREGVREDPQNSSNTFEFVPISGENTFEFVPISAKNTFEFVPISGKNTFEFVRTAKKNI